MKKATGELKGKLHEFLTSALHGGGQLHVSTALSIGKKLTVQ
jgi:hypothetical protein